MEDKTLERKAFALKTLHEVLEDEIKNVDDEDIKNYLIKIKKKYPTSKEVVHKHFKDMAEQYISHNANFI